MSVVPVVPATAPDRGAAMALLASGVPLSLLLDLACGPRSEELLVFEQPQAYEAVPAQRRS
ncbi:MAG TPA: hypothetical protein VNU66_14360 [Mycobacteriales bacterium]|nr:hypothetical protein [Mycobacteriales bacterium]